MTSFTLITGATSGFGKACAYEFGKQGRNLILTGRRNDRLQTLKTEIESDDVLVKTLCFDVRSYEDTALAISTLGTEAQINCLVNNAGLAVGRGPINEGELDDWNRMLDTNVKGLLHVSKCVIPLMEEHSTIINIGSIAGKEVYPGGNVYCASKHAVDALSKGMRIDLLPQKIKVSQIAPGAADTEFSLVRFKGDEQTAKEVYKGYEALVAKDIAEAAWFIASRPNHVAINDMVIMPSAQATAQNFYKTETL